MAMLGKESAICFCNHRSDVDWLIGYTLADRVGVLAVGIFFFCTDLFLVFYHRLVM